MRHTNSLMWHFVFPFNWSRPLSVCLLFILPVALSRLKWGNFFFFLCTKWPLSVCVLAYVCMHIYTVCLCMHKSVWIYVCIFLLRAHSNPVLLWAEQWAVSGSSLTSISQVWHMLAFCTNTVQWSALHYNPAIMTALCVCVCSLQKSANARGHREENSTRDGN